MCATALACSVLPNWSWALCATHNLFAFVAAEAAARYPGLAPVSAAGHLGVGTVLLACARSKFVRHCRVERQSQACNLGKLSRFSLSMPALDLLVHGCVAVADK